LQNRNVAACHEYPNAGDAYLRRIPLARIGKTRDLISGAKAGRNHDATSAEVRAQ